MTSSFTIPEDEQAQLRVLARTTKDKKTADRVRIILALAAGDRASDVARIFCIDEPTVRKWKNRYLKRRLFSDWLASLQVGYAGKLTKDQLTEIEHYVETEMVTDAAVVVTFIKTQYGKRYTVDGVTKLLHRLGFVYKQTTLIPGKLNEAAQAAFMKEYEQLRDSLPGDEVVLFADGVHPSHNVYATKAWIKRGQDKQVPTNTGRARLNINGALNLETMSVVTYFSHTIDAIETTHLLDAIQLEYSDKNVIHLVTDNAQYYKSKIITEYLAREDCRIKFRYLPPYSPNLNFIERLWHYLHKHGIGVKRRDSFKEFEADVHKFFDVTMKTERDAIRKFIGTEMHLITVH
jgi:transposase